MENASESRKTLKSGSIISRNTMFSNSSVSNGGSNKPLIIGGRFRVGRKFGAGNFGEIRYGIDMFTKQSYAIKIESRRARVPQLNFEYKVYKILGEAPGIPKIYYYGPCSVCNSIVMEYLGKNLEELFMLCSRKFSTLTVINIAMQLIRRFEFIHSKGIVFRDVKPENFVIGSTPETENVIHVIDFGLSKEYFDFTTKKHIPYKENRSLTGTARYMSVNTHLGIEQSRRDDMESLGYLFIYLMRGALPWQGLKATNARERYHNIGKVKKTTSLDNLCSNLSTEFYKYLEYVKKLSFTETPDYDYLYNLFESAREKYKNKRTEFDWIDSSNLSSLTDRDFISNQANNGNDSRHNYVPMSSHTQSPAINERQLTLNNQSRNNLRNNENETNTLPNNTVQNSGTMTDSRPQSCIEDETKKNTFRMHSRKLTPAAIVVSSKNSNVNTSVPENQSDKKKFSIFDCCLPFKKARNKDKDVASVVIDRDR